MHAPGRPEGGQNRGVIMTEGCEAFHKEKFRHTGMKHTDLGAAVQAQLYRHLVGESSREANTPNSTVTKGTRR